MPHAAWRSNSNRLTRSRRRSMSRNMYYLYILVHDRVITSCVLVHRIASVILFALDPHCILCRQARTKRSLRLSLLRYRQDERISREGCHPVVMCLERRVCTRGDYKPRLFGVQTPPCRASIAPQKTSSPPSTHPLPPLSRPSPTTAVTTERRAAAAR